ncbi:MAG: hypothetical protein IT343_02750 [Candidatus Melainabacteria bacterium]|jgi:hypothetical protein|nr:hypothetical protein [Candidatus Melainabacteria bacterium]
MPLVTLEALKEMRQRLPHCHLTEYRFFRPEEKLIYLVSNFAGEGLTIINMEKALATSDELLTYNPDHPALHGARALINYRMGNFEQFRQDFRNTKDTAKSCGHEDLRYLAMQFLAFDNNQSVRNAIEAHHPERYIANHLLISGIRPSRKQESIEAMHKRMSAAADINPAASLMDKRIQPAGPYILTT